MQKLVWDFTLIYSDSAVCGFEFLACYFPKAAIVICRTWMVCNVALKFAFEGLAE